MKQREIKFRVWSTIKSDGEMLYLKSGMLSDLEGLPAWKVMQYTGLKDKNGKEIYEGDIVTRKNKTYIVEYELGGFQFSGISAYVMQGEVTIIGNICENPELL